MMREQKNTSPLRVNLGCGHNPPSGWVNVDYALGARFAKLPLFNTVNRKLKFFRWEWDRDILIHDLRETLPWEDSSVDVIYSSHTLEHLSGKEGKALLKECYRILKENGLIRILVPDLKAVVLQYLDEKLHADEFIDRLMIRYDAEGDGFVKRLLSHLIRAPHKCLYDTPSLLRIMGEVGFTMSPKAAFESDVENIQQIELAERTGGVVILEGRKATV